MIDDKPIEPAPLDFEPDYPIPVFSKYGDFWSTGPGGWESLTGGGLADYSSRGFYTRKYNHGNLMTSRTAVADKLEMGGFGPMQRPINPL